MKKQAVKKFLELNRNSKQRVTMVATIEKGGSICSIGINNYKRKSYSHKRRNGFNRLNGLHAEMAAILKCNKHTLKGSTIKIMGITISGKYVKSKPCKACRAAIEAVGIKKVIWYDSELQAYVWRV